MEAANRQYKETYEKMDAQLRMMNKKHQELQKKLAQKSAKNKGTYFLLQ